MSATTIPSTESQPVDLASYLSRVDYHEKLDTSSRTLAALHQRHLQTFPFENLDVLRDKEISIELPAIANKLIAQHRGGYCFEQNGLFAEILRQIGFTVIPHIARVRWMADPAAISPLSHLVLQVETTDGPFLADVGFGGVGLVEPIRMDIDSEQHAEFEPRRLLHRGRERLHQVRLGDTWHDVYQFPLDTAHPIDQEIANWYSFTHPKARFRNSLLVAKTTPTGRLIIADSEFIQRSWSGQATRTPIPDLPTLLSLLKTHFNIHLPPETTLAHPHFQ